MRLPRDLTGAQLVKALEKRFEYRLTRQTGSHMRLTCRSAGEHHVTIPKHDPLKIGTLSAILTDVAEHHKISRDQLLTELLGRKQG